MTLIFPMLLGSLRVEALKVICRGTNFVIGICSSYYAKLKKTVVFIFHEGRFDNVQIIDNVTIIRKAIAIYKVSNYKRRRNIF